MSVRKKNSKAVWATAVTILLLAGAAAVVFFRGDLLGFGGADLEVKLLPSVKVTGTINAEDLNLSGREIASLNKLSRSYGDLFSTMNMNLVLENKFAPIDIKQDTIMILKLICTARGAEVVFRSREVRRSELVTHMQRSMKKAETEFLRYSGTGRKFKRIEI